MVENEKSAWSEFSGPNAADPCGAVRAGPRRIRSWWTPARANCSSASAPRRKRAGPPVAAADGETAAAHIAGAVELATAIRDYGHAPRASTRWAASPGTRPSSFETHGIAGGRPGGAARLSRRGPGGGVGGERAGSDPAAAAHLLAPPATSSSRSRTRRSGPGCATRLEAGFIRPTIRSTSGSCSSG